MRALSKIPMLRSRPIALLVAASLAVPLLAQAVSFPDVPSSNPYRQQIENLAAKDVITGNPDGTFRPGNPVNRAALLKMLYIATGKKPDGALGGCFKADVVPDAWYAPYVCDAVFRGYVQGYGDGTFRPGYPVTRAEALKLVVAVFGFDKVHFQSTQYTDVAVGDWFADYVATAVSLGILPIGTQMGLQLLPHEPLTRAEAAAYIWNALQVWTQEQGQSSSSAAAASSVSSQAAQQSSSSKPKATFDDTGASARVMNVAVPFDDAQTFVQKTPFSYRFTLASPTVVDATAALRFGERGSLTCTLYRLAQDETSTEYYIGFVDGTSCLVHASLLAGNYQLQLQPTQPGTQYTVESTVGKSDGNDGFSEAQPLTLEKVRTSALEANDLDDWYTFTGPADREMTLTLVSNSALRCLVYPGANVDIFGFSGPACNTAYLYPAGTYYVDVGHALPRAVRQSYTIQLK